MNRLNKILKQCDINKNNNNNTNKCNIRCNNVASYTSDTNDDDVVIVSGIRTAIGKAKRGSFAVYIISILYICLCLICIYIVIL